MRFFKKAVAAFCLCTLLLTPSYATAPAASFQDVPADSPSYEAIQWLYQSGYTSGDGQGHFMPDSALTLRDSLYLLSAASGISLSELEAEVPQLEKSSPISTNGFYALLFQAYDVVPNIGETYILDSVSGYIFTLTELGTTAEDGQAVRGEYYMDSTANPTYTFPETPITRADAATAIYMAASGQLVQQAPEVYQYMNLHLDAGYGAGLADLFRYVDMIPDPILKQFDADGWVIVYGDVFLNEMSQARLADIRGLHTMATNTIYTKLPDVVCHEMGHWIYYVDDVNWILEDCYLKEKQAAIELIRPYAGSNKTEFFADVFSYFVRNHGDKTAMDIFASSIPSAYHLLLEMEQTGWLTPFDWDIPWPTTGWQPENSSKRPRAMPGALCISEEIPRFRWTRASWPAQIMDLPHRRHQDLAGSTIDIDQALTGGGGAKQGLAGPLHSEVQAPAPSNGHIAVDLDHIVLQFNGDQFLLGAGGRQADGTVAHQTQIEQALVAGNRRREIGAHHSLMFDLGIAGQEQPVIQNNAAVPLGQVQENDVLVGGLQHQYAVSSILGFDCGFAGDAAP